MVFKITRLGDICDHGAVVITGDDTRYVEDRKVARVGDLVYCPIPGHGINPIIATTAAVKIVNDRKTSHLVSITQCGARLVTGSDTVIIDRQPDMLDEPDAPLF